MSEGISIVDSFLTLSPILETNNQKSPTNQTKNKKKKKTYENRMHAFVKMLHHKKKNQKHFSLTNEQVHVIVKKCPSCMPLPSCDMTPQGLLPNHIWHMDVPMLLALGD